MRRLLVTIDSDGEVAFSMNFLSLMIGVPLAEFADHYAEDATQVAEWPEEWKQRMRRRYQEGSAHTNSDNLLIAFDWWARRAGHYMVAEGADVFLDPLP
ncbi:hypothetical protein [Williamsia sp. 1135]|uniref:hypothetical protein n=1 Tax=Williamsia sp. 1135 TaxID=1889262 RepID=UPI000A10AB34|nr:hypothetical protein [Williamsia sp. 1135]ORM29198.1 hypothetical protein BFL43_20405 [Williamsia sp. 1135]